jgi:SAM-dependent methyltransferase
MPDISTTKKKTIVPQLVCPKTRISLQNKESHLSSSDGKSVYPVVNGIPIFANLDDFYENRWSKTDTSTGGLRNLLVKKQRFFLRHLRNQQGTLLDLGCGGGWKLLAKVGNVTGIDLSCSSLKAADSIYDRVVQADWTMLPFPDCSFDFVVSSDVLGHVPDRDKDKVWSEIVRVLKPGGLTLHYIEADSQDPLMNWCKKYPDLYKKYIIDTEGHIGMETARQTMLRFRKFNLEPIEEKGVYRLLMYVNRVHLLLDNEYRDRSFLINILVLFARLILSNKVTEIIANLLLVVLLEIFDIILPEDWSNGVLVMYRKIDNKVKN